LGTAILANEFIEANYITGYDENDYVAVGRRYFPSSPTIQDITAYIGSEALITDIDTDYITSNANDYI